VYDKADCQCNAVADYLPEDLPSRLIPNLFRELLQLLCYFPRLSSGTHPSKLRHRR
jgi:hypothetical protein